MNCPACGHENRQGAKFCEECAAPLKRACAACGSELRPAAKFCDECGAATASNGARSEPHASGTERERPADAAGTRKIITIIFADLVGSTALHERLDPESARVFMEGYYRAMRGAVEGYGGTVTQLLGDGVKAVFGAPRVAEDDAIRAVRAAVAMQRAFRELAERYSRLVGKTGLRVAVNTGEVVASDETEIIGDPVNVAARLQEQGRDGDVVIGEATHRLVSQLVTLTFLGSFTLKGRVEAVKAYRVVSLERPAGAAATVFVGREDELARIGRVYETATVTPAARLAVLLGSPGLGKSRLIEEFSRRQSDSATVVFAHCEATGGATFAPLAEALREFLHIDNGVNGEGLRATIDVGTPGNDADRARIVDGITALVAGSPAPPEETFFVVRRMLAALAGVRPVVLVIDDLQWAEPLFLDLVEHLVQWGSGVPLLVLAGARPELRDTRSSLTTPGGLVADVVTLGGLDAGAAMRLAANVIGAADLPAAVAAKVLATSEGNPLFVGELVRMLVQEGGLERQGERWTIGAGLAEIEMPPTIHALLAARIERLRPEERSVLERAAVVGRQFSRSAVAELLPRDVADLDARLESLRRSELIERDTGWFLGEPVLRFHHVLIRDAAYRRVLKGTRAELHARFADWIEARAGESVEHDEMIGWHLEQAHQHLGELGPIDDKGRALGERAAHYLAAAGRRALARDDLPLAASLLGRALDRLHNEDPQRADLALDWCEALLAAGDVGPAATAIEELGRFIADSERLRAWHTCFAGQLTVFTSPQALHAATDAVAAAAETLTSLGDAAGEATAHFVHAQALARLGKVGACEAALDRALAAARRAGDRRRANAVLARAPLAALWGPSPVTRASGRCLDVVRVLRITQGAPAVEAIALSCQGLLEALRGRTNAARRMIASSRKMVEELGITHRLHEADVFAGQIDLLEGDAVAAEHALRGAYEGLRDLGLGIDAAQAAALLARALLAQNRAAEAETLSHESELLAGDDLKAAIAWRGVRAEALARRGEHVAAVALAEAAVAIASATDALLDHADARLALAAALRAAGRSSDANAEERRAHELWDAKGATLLAERAQGGGERVETIARSQESQANAPRSRSRVRMNAATADAAGLDAAIAARDPAALLELFADDLEVDDRTTGVVFDRQGAVTSFASLITARDPRCRNEPLATLGDSLALCHISISASGVGRGALDVGAYEKEELHLSEVDARGRRRRGEVFAADRLDDAIVRLYERYAELVGDGSARARAAETARAIDSILLRDHDSGAWASAVAPDAEQLDHRQLGTWNARGPDAIVAQIRSLGEVADGVRLRTHEILELTPEALLLRRMHSGTERPGGGSYERPLLLLLAFVTDGRVGRVEFFDDDAEATALARVHELVGHTQSKPVPTARRRVRPNAATATTARWEALFAAGDGAALGDVFGDVFEAVDHPNGAAYGRDALLDSFRRFLRTQDPRMHHEPIATLGESLTLFLRTITASGTGGGRFDVGPYEREEIGIFEVDAQGLFRRAEVFAAGHLGDAVARLYARYAEMLPDGPARVRAAATAGTLASFAEPFDLDRFTAQFAPAVEVVDYRSVGYGTLHGTEVLARSVRALMELTEGFDRRFDDVFAASPNVLLVCDSSFGTQRSSGGAFERSICELFVFGADGLVTRWERFDLEHQAEALARFDELTTESAGAQPVRRRVRPNAATAAAAHLAAVFAARDDAAHDALFSESLEVISHPNGASYGREGHLDSVRRLWRATDPKIEFEFLATLGESLFLSRRRVAASGTSGGRYDVGKWQREEIVLAEVDTHGRFQRLEIFAVDHLGDAIYRLYERYAELFSDGPARARAEATARVVSAFVGPPDLEAYCAVLRPDFELIDRRILGFGSVRGVEGMRKYLAALFETSEQFSVRIDDVLAHRSGAILIEWTTVGTARVGGGAFERHYIQLWVFGGDGLFARMEHYDIERVGDAFARFDEVDGSDTKPASRFANAASRALERSVRCFNTRDWDGMVATYTPTHRMDDRRKLMRIEVAGSDFFTNERFLYELPDSAWDVALLATRGERLALCGVKFTAGGDGGAESGPMIVEVLDLIEVDAERRRTALVIFDPDDVDAAYADLDARYQAGEGAGYGIVPAAFLDTTDAIDRRDWEALAARLASEFSLNDHRVLGWGTTLNDKLSFVRAQQALVELSPDARYRVDHLRASSASHLCWCTQFGTREGGAFETQFLNVGAWGQAGRARGYDVYDVEQSDEAFARFEELSGATTRERVAEFKRDHPVVEAMQRWETAFNLACKTDDWDPLRATCAAGFIFEDRQRMALVSGDRDVMIASARERATSGARPERRLIATAGDRVALWRLLWSGGPADGRFEIQYLTLGQVDDTGLFTAIAMFDEDNAQAAQREAWARWSAIDAKASPWLPVLAEGSDAFNAADSRRLRALLSDDFAYRDERRISLGAYDADALVESLRAWVGLAPDLHLEVVRFLAWDRHGAVPVARFFGTFPGGGPFEHLIVSVFLVEGGRIRIMEDFDLDDADRAVARFEELRPDPLHIPPNRARRLHDKLGEPLTAGDWSALRAFASRELRYEDRGKRALVTGDVETWVASMQFAASLPDVRYEFKTLATFGDRIVLDLMTWKGGPDGEAFEIERIRLLEIDAQGRARTNILFDCDDRAAAFTEAQALFAAGEAAEIGGQRPNIAFIEAFVRRDWDALRETLAPDLRHKDHRVLGLGSLHRDQWVDSLRALCAIGTDVRLEIMRHIVLNRRGGVIAVRQIGAIPEGGGSFENLFISLYIVEEHATHVLEVFDIEDSHRAVARFEELCRALEGEHAARP